MSKLVIKTQHVAVGDDLEVAYRKWGSEKFGGLPIVAVHGDWTTSASWTRLAAELTERWILAPDLRGRGVTRGPDHGYSIAELRDDLLGFLDAMQLGRIHLIGHELGAAIAAELARLEPGRVATLTLIAVPWVDGMPELRVDRDAVQRYTSNARAFSQARTELGPKVPRDMLWAGLIEAGFKQRLSAGLGAIDALVAWRPGDALAELSMPRRIVDGELDPVTGGEVAARAASALDCPRITVAKVGQLVHLEDPETLADEIRKLVGTS